MALEPQEEIWMEVHKLDQFFRMEEGTREALRDGVHTKISTGSIVPIPAGGTRCGQGRMIACRERKKQGESVIFFGVSTGVLPTTTNTPFEKPERLFVWIHSSPLF